MTIDELVVLTTRRLNVQRPIKESRINREDLFMLVPQAMDVLCDSISQQPNLRGHLMQDFPTLEIASGKILLTQTPALGMHKGSLRFSQLYNDSDDPSMIRSYIFKEQLHLMDGDLDMEFGYFALQGDNLVLRNPATSEDSMSNYSGTASMVALKIPFQVSGWELPANGELIQQASDTLAAEYLKLFPSK